LRSEFATWLLIFVSFAALCLCVYRVALNGPFISDDALYIQSNPYVRMPVPNLVGAVFDPAGEARFSAGGNYAPVHLLAHALEWRVWGSEVFGYHVVNVVLHALCATLLVALLHASAIPKLAAILGGTLFALHPANVEAVAWISQLKSLLAMAFALAALLLFRRHPLASALPFALALLSKAAAVFALPMAAAFFWSWRRRGGTGRAHALALALWIAVFAAYAPAQYTAFDTMGRAFAEPDADAWSQVRSIAAIGSRYLVMAATGYGTSAFHEPEPVRDLLDPWWLAGLVLGPALLWRIAATLRRRREEAAWWLGAAVAFAPVSQIFPFYYAMADRYLYFILPGLLGGALLAGSDLLARHEPRHAKPQRWAAVVTAAACAMSVLLSARFGFHAEARASLWTDADRLAIDAIGQYPNGTTAEYVRGMFAAHEGDADRALEHLRAAADRGYHHVVSYQTDPRLAPLHSDPRFLELVRDIAGRHIAFARERGFSSQTQLRSVAAAHYFRGEVDEAIETYERAVRIGGPLDSILLQEMEEIRQRRADQRCEAPAGAADP